MTRQQPTTDYCEKFGFDADWRKGRLELLHLNANDIPLGERLRTEFVVPNIPSIIAAFYARLDQNAEARKILDGVERANLEASQAAYLTSFGADFTERSYFEERLRIGVVHAWVGVPLGLYLCSFQILQAVINDHIRSSDLSRQDYRALCELVFKIGILDASLASEIYHIAQMRDMEVSVAHLEREWSAMRQAANTDALTNLANRAYLMPRLGRLLAEAIRDGRPLCVVMADLDHFKPINDTHGHQVGDQVLRDTAARLRAAVRDFDLVARYGGEEFIAVLRDTPLETALQVAERIRKRIGDSPFNIAGTSLVVTISQGIAQVRSGDSVDALIERADAALYRAKQAGRNCVVVDDDPSRD